MVDLDIKQKIILRYREGISIRQIAQELEVHRKTVSNYIADYEYSVNELSGLTDKNDIRRYQLTDNIVESPKYRVSNRKKRKLTKEMIDEIKLHLKENEEKVAKGMKKQQKKKIDIYNALKEKNYDVSYSTVTNIISSIENRRKEGFIKQEYYPGDICEFDWGEVKLSIEGKIRIFQMAVFTSAKGNYRYAKLFPKQNTACFMESHVAYLEHIQGVYKTIVYDNMKVAVKKFVGHAEKEPTEALLKLSIYYGFKFRFCNTRCGNEKGHVERSVEYIRRKAFCNVDEFRSLEEANKHLLENCRKLNNEKKSYNDNKTALDFLEKEREYLLPIKPALDTAIIKDVRVDKYSTISVNTCRYSVPDYYVGKLITAKVYSEKIVLYDDSQNIAVHDIKLGLFNWSIKLEHYVITLKRKPGALKNSTAMCQVDERIKNIYEQYYSGKEKEFVDLIQYMKDNNKDIKDVEESIKNILNITPCDVSTEKIIAIASRNKINELITENTEILDISNKLLKELSIIMPSLKVEKEAA